MKWDHGSHNRYSSPPPPLPAAAGTLEKLVGDEGKDDDRLNGSTALCRQRCIVVVVEVVVICIKGFRGGGAL